MRLVRRAIFRALMALGLAASAAHALPSGATSWSPSEDDALLLDVRLGQYKLGDGVRGYTTPNGPCVDFSDMILALDLPIRLDKQSRRATGWAFDEAQTIIIDRASNAEHIRNKFARVAPDDIRDTREGWCVTSAALARWLNVEVMVDSANALLTIKADRKLAPELAAERRARIVRAPPTFDLATLPHATAPYRNVSPPAVDVVANLGGVRDRRQGNRSEAGYEVFVAGEAGPVSYDARLASNRRGAPESLRLRAYRYDPDARLLGPLHATQLAVGDVVGLATPLVAQATLGRGALLTNRPLDRPPSFDRTQFSGDLPRGWDAELYRNGELLAFAQDRLDGRYRFDDVPLLFGNNRFEIVLYGPQGQTRREIARFPVGLDAVPPGRAWYWASVDEDGRDLVALRGERHGLGWRGVLGVEYGLGLRSMASAYVHQAALPDRNSRASYFEGAFRRSLGPVLFELSGSQQSGAGRAFRLQALGELAGSSIALESIVAHGYESDRVERGTATLHRASIDRTVGSGRGAVPVHVEARYLVRRDGREEFDTAARTSLSLARLSLTGEIGWRRRWDRSFGATGEVRALFLGSGRIGPVRVRGELQARLVPDARFDVATLVAEWNEGKDLTNPTQWRVEGGYDRALRRARAAVGYVRRFDRLSLNASVEAASDGSLGAGLAVAFSLGRDPVAGGFRMRADKLAADGSALVRVFRDLDGNGRRDPGEPLERGVGLAAGQVSVARPTDAQGRALADGLEPFRPTLVSVDAATLASPFVQPSGPGVVVVPRPGRITLVDLPLVAAGDVDGTIVRSGGTALPGLDLELLRDDGTAAATTRSDYDGYFVFQGVPYGTYRLAIARLSASAARLAIELRRRVIVDDAHPSAHLGAVTANSATTPLPN